MPTVRRLSLIDQTVLHLCEGLRAGRWKDRLPGQRPLADELGVSRHTLRAAMGELVKQGILLKGELGDSYAVASQAWPESVRQRSDLRIALLFVEPLSSEAPEIQRLVMDIIGRLKSEGHDCLSVNFPSGKDSHKTGYLPRLVEETRADAWIVVRGTQEVLEWFVAAQLPVLAFGGRAKELPVAAVGFDGSSFVRKVVRRLVELGHQRIVLISSHAFRRPAPGLTVRTFQEELASAGVRVSEYHTPDWEETPDGLCRLLDSLFRFTPPTALLCVPMCATHGALGWLARRGKSVPSDVSLVTWGGDPSLAWHFPGLKPAHPVDDYALFMKNVFEWVAEVADGRPPRWQRSVEPHFNEGNTVSRARPNE